MPLILEDLAATARYQHFLQSRTPDDRFRIAARDGQLKVWTEKITPDHRNRFEGGKDAAGHADAHDLAGIRTRPAGASQP